MQISLLSPQDGAGGADVFPFNTMPALTLQRAGWVEPFAKTIIFAGPQLMGIASLHPSMLRATSCPLYFTAPSSSAAKARVPMRLMALPICFAF